MLVVVGDTVLLRDGRLIRVTDASYQDTSLNEDPSLPAETIVIGYAVHPELYEDPNLGEPGYRPKSIVTDVSEVVSILN